MAKQFVVVEGYSDESTPRRITEYETLNEAVWYFNEVLHEIAKDHKIIREMKSNGTLNPIVFGWREGKRQRYCAVRRNTVDV